MSATRVVAPESDRLTLSNGDWVEVKRRLNAGENRRVVARSQFAPVVFTLYEVVMYLLDWSLVDAVGKKLPIKPVDDDGVSKETEASLDSIDPDDYNEIFLAIEKHKKEQKARRDQEKKHQGGAQSASVTSTSPAGVDGHSTTSEVSTSTTTTSALS